MHIDSMFLGIDLGSSGVRVAVSNKQKEMIYFSETKYPEGLEKVEDWAECCKELIVKIPKAIKGNIKACSVDGTSGTILACNFQGVPLGEALPFNKIFCKHKKLIENLFSDNKDIFYKNSSLSRAFELIEIHGKDILLRHQADWINGWLMNDWRLGEEGNNLRLGWDSTRERWPFSYKKLSWISTLPKIVKSGCKIGNICPDKAKSLGLSKDTLIIAGTTDSNASVIASGAKLEDGISVLGTTIVVKKFVPKPLEGLGISNHKISGNWIAGGASNAGCKIFDKLFTNKELLELSKQINPYKKSGLKLIPLPARGERFPINDPYLEPVLEPRPISDSLYLHAIFEGLANIEAQGWEKLIQLGAKKPKRIITIGGGAKNPQWKIIREKVMNMEIKTSILPTAYGASMIALEAFDD